MASVLNIGSDFLFMLLWEKMTHPALLLLIRFRFNDSGIAQMLKYEDIYILSAKCNQQLCKI